MIFDILICTLLVMVPVRSRVQCWYAGTKVFLYYSVHVLYMRTILYLLKKPHLKPLGSFKGFSIHRDGHKKATLFYTML
jgi:hypothetical protein